MCATSSLLPHLEPAREVRDERRQQRREVRVVERRRAADHVDLDDVTQHARGVPVLERVGRRGERRAAHVRADLARLVGERGAVLDREAERLRRGAREVVAVTRTPRRQSVREAILTLTLMASSRL